jgi:hypothetical protein
MEGKKGKEVGCIAILNGEEIFAFAARREKKTTVFTLTIGFCLILFSPLFLGHQI